MRRPIPVRRSSRPPSRVELAALLTAAGLFSTHVAAAQGAPGAGVSGVKDAGLAAPIDVDAGPDAATCPTNPTLGGAPPFRDYELHHSGCCGGSHDSELSSGPARSGRRSHRCWPCSRSARAGGAPA